MDPDETPYQGFFYDSQSSDIVAKVVFNIFIFVSIVLSISWVLSRRRSSSLPILDENFPDVSMILKGRDVMHLARYRTDIPNEVLYVHTGSQYICMVKKWYLMEQVRQNTAHLRVFSRAPENVRRDWRGLTFSDQFTPGYSDFRTLFDLSLLNFPTFAHIGGARFGLQLFAHFLERQQSTQLSAPEFNLLALHVLCATALLRTEPGKPIDQATDETEKVILGLDRLLHSLLQIHVDGKLRSGVEPDVSMTAIFKAADALFNPIILLEIERVTAAKLEEQSEQEEEADGWNFVSPSRCAWTTSLLSHLLSYKSLLEEEEGTDFSFLTLRHISHSLLEILLLGRHTLAVCLHTCLTVLAERPDWRAHLRKELAAHAVGCQRRGVSAETQLTDDCLEVEVDCLPWTKALCLETLRFTVAGWPFDALFEATRDGQISDHNYNAGDLILLNEPLVFHDPGVWFGAADRSAAEVYDSVGSQKRPFNPFNFADLHSSTTAYLVSNLLLSSGVCQPPRTFIYRLFLATLVELFGRGWEFEVDGPLPCPQNLNDPACRFHALGRTLPALTLLRSNSQ
nr:unnamed protein product [Spirometra erinaceieuropaei]